MYRRIIGKDMARKKRLTRRMMRDLFPAPAPHRPPSQSDHGEEHQTAQTRTERIQVGEVGRLCSVRTGSSLSQLSVQGIVDMGVEMRYVGAQRQAKRERRGASYHEFFHPHPCLHYRDPHKRTEYGQRRV